MVHVSDELVQRFYAALARRDGDTMAACYAPGARFWAPVFTDLRGEEPGAMSRMLNGRAEDLDVKLAEHEAGEERGSTHWLADYTFSTGRKVHRTVFEGLMQHDHPRLADGELDGRLAAAHSGATAGS